MDNMAFIQYPVSLLQQRSKRSHVQIAASVRMSAVESKPQLSRRALLSGVAAAALIQVSPVSFPKDARASVDIDIERFGDKGTSSN